MSFFYLEQNVFFIHKIQKPKKKKNNNQLSFLGGDKAFSEP